MAERTTKKRPARKAGAKKAPVAGRKKKAKRELSLEEEIIGAIHKEVDDSAAMVLGNDTFLAKIRGVISTQAPTLDAAFGRGGAPLGRLTLIHGFEAAGKTTLALHLCAEVQRRGGVAMYIDKEYKLDPDYVKDIGVNIDRMIVSRPDTLEQVIKVIKATISKLKARRERTKKFKPLALFVDSLNACQSFETIEKEEGKRQYPNEARVWSEELPELIKLCSKEDIALVLLSQVRKKLNVMFGDDNNMAGGNAPKFHASCYVFLRRIKTLKRGKAKDSPKIGIRVEAELKKNQIASPFRKAQYNVIFGKGIDYQESLLTLAIERKVVTKKGNTFVFKGESLDNARARVVNMIREDEELQAEIIASIDAKEKKRKALREE